MKVQKESGEFRKQGFGAARVRGVGCYSEGLGAGGVRGAPGRQASGEAGGLCQGMEAMLSGEDSRGSRLSGAQAGGLTDKWILDLRGPLIQIRMEEITLPCSLGMEI